MDSTQQYFLYAEVRESVVLNKIGYATLGTLRLKHPRLFSVPNSLPSVSYPQPKKKTRKTKLNINMHSLTKQIPTLAIFCLFILIVLFSSWKRFFINKKPTLSILPFINCILYLITKSFLNPNSERILLPSSFIYFYDVVILSLDCLEIWRSLWYIVLDAPLC